MRQNDRSTSRFVPRLRHAALALAALALLAAGAGAAKAGGDDGESLWGESYAGVFIGAGRADNRIVDVEGFANWGEPGWAVDYDESAPVGGALIGTKLAIGGMPLRLELDGMTGGGGLAASANTLDPEGLDETVETSFGWIVTARAGVEYALAEGMTLFATAGVAAAQIERSVTDMDSPRGLPPHVDHDDSFSDDSMEIGWAIGAGVETALADGWTLRLEGSYMDFGSSTHPVNHSGGNRCGPEGPQRRPASTTWSTCSAWCGWRSSTASVFNLPFRSTHALARRLPPRHGRTGSGHPRSHAPFGGAGRRRCPDTRNKSGQVRA